MQLYLCGHACLTITCVIDETTFKGGNDHIQCLSTNFVNVGWMPGESTKVNRSMILVLSFIFNFFFWFCYRDINTNMKSPAIGNDYAAMSSSSNTIHARRPRQRVHGSWGKKRASLLIANEVWSKKDKMLKKSITSKLNLKCLLNVLSQTYEAALDILPPHGDPVYEKVKHSLLFPQWQRISGWF